MSDKGCELQIIDQPLDAADVTRRLDAIPLRHAGKPRFSKRLVAIRRSAPDG